MLALQEPLPSERTAALRAGPRIGLAVCDDSLLAWLSPCLTSLGEIVNLREIGDLSRTLRTAPPLDALILEQAPGLDVRIAALVQSASAHVPILLVSPAEGAPRPSGPGVFFGLRPTMQRCDVVSIVQAATGVDVGGAAARPVGNIELRQRVLSAAAQLVGASDLGAAAAVAVNSIHSFVDADRAACLFYDDDAGELWSESDEARSGCASDGLLGFAVRTRQPQVVPRVGSDARYERQLDDPEGDSDARLLVVPVADGLGVQAVFVAARDGAGAPFADDDVAVLANFAERAGPMLQHLSQLVETEMMLRSQEDTLFRSESLHEHARPGYRGDVVRVSPGWIRWAYWVLVLLALAAGVYLVLGRVDQYSAGPAVIGVHDRTEVAAQGSGPLVAVEVTRGDHVDAGAVLARVDSSELDAELRRVRHEFHTQLRKRMLNVADREAAQALISLRGQERGVLDHLALRQIRAPHAGTVMGPRVRVGQHIDVGDVVTSVIRDDDSRRVVALLPGGDRPKLHSGMPLRLELRGYRYTYQSLVIDEISDEVIGPEEARRLLGPQVGDAVPIPGPVVVVRATLPSANFVSDDEQYEYHDGMLGLAEVKVRAESILETLIPALKRLRSDD